MYSELTTARNSTILTVKFDIDLSTLSYVTNVKCIILIQLLAGTSALTDTRRASIHVELETLWDLSMKWKQIPNPAASHFRRCVDNKSTGFFQHL